MLQRLMLKNFKLFDDQGITITPGKITVLIGVNGSGKSSILQALLILKQSAKTEQIVPVGQSINIGTLKDIVHARDIRRPIEIGISAVYRNFDVKRRIEPHISPSGTFDYDARFVDGKLESSKVVVGGDDGEKLIGTLNPFTQRVNVKEIVVEDIARVEVVLTRQVGYPLGLEQITPIEPIQDETLKQQVNVLTQPVEITTVRGQINDLLSTILTMLQDFAFVPAIRGFEYLTYNIWQGDPPSSMTGMRGLDDVAAFVANVFSSDPDLAERVSESLMAVFQRSGRLRYRLEQGRLATELADKGKSINLFNEAFGLSQLVIPLLALNSVPSGALIGIEEPENHLHPRAQAALCNVLVDAVVRFDKQLILTTHSEHILMGLLTAVANGQLHPNDLAVYEFRRDNDSARAERLEVNEYGQIAGGLKGFLEADLDEIGELLEARFR